MTSISASDSTLWGAVASAASSTSTASSGTAGNNTLGKDAFLKLLVAQLKYQDPSKPVDSAQFMSQTAQFSQVEKLEEMATSSSAALAAQQRLTAASMVGKTIGYTGTDGTPMTGVVSAAVLSGGTGTSTPVLRVTASGGSVDVPLASVSEVRSA